MIDPYERIIIMNSKPFVRSNGTLTARCYERLTKRSRRLEANLDHPDTGWEHAYRKGVYDAYKSLQSEVDKFYND